jgi:hypothetical protein
MRSRVALTFEELWTEMEQSAAGQSGVLLRRVHVQAASDLFLGLETPEDRRILALHVGNEVAPRSADLPKTKGFETRLARSSVEGKAALEIRLTDLGASDLFSALAEDVAQVVSAAEDDAAAVSAWLLRLEQWRRLLQRGAAQGLTPEAQRGLYAELWVLRAYLAGQFGDAAVTAWTGPSHASHDFEFDSGAIEVKATAGKQHQTLRIASERQLDGTGTPALFLFHLSLDVRQGDGESLPEAVESVRTLLADGGSLSDFEVRLFDAGYQDIHAPQYQGRAYTVREENFFAVLDGFPRIVESDLRPGVGDLTYSVAVAECKHFAVTADEVLVALGGDPVVG